VKRNIKWLTNSILTAPPPQGTPLGSRPCGGGGNATFHMPRRNLLLPVGATYRSLLPIIFKTNPFPSTDLTATHGFAHLISLCLVQSYTALLTRPSVLSCDAELPMRMTAISCVMVDSRWVWDATMSRTGRLHTPLENITRIGTWSPRFDN
jgi:hypothetical protein